VRGVGDRLRCEVLSSYRKGGAQLKAEADNQARLFEAIALILHGAG
jgi:hypothetical protein